MSGVVFSVGEGFDLYIVVAMTVLASEPVDHQTLLYSAFLFADARTGIPVMERSLTDRA